MTDASLLRATYIAPAGLCWLGEARDARVLHVFKPVCNLADSAGNVLSLVAEGIGPGPFAAVMEPPSGGFSRWVDHLAPVQITPDGVSVGPLRIDCSAAAVWNPVLPRFDDPPRALSALPGWIGEFLNQHAAPDSPFLAPSEKIKAALREIDQGVRVRDAAALGRAAASLAGLGPGLTPSGDDYLVGVLFGLWMLYSEGETAHLRSAIREGAVGRTTTLSQAWLRAAAEGEANAPWQDFAAGFAEGDFSVEAARRIVATGHTSGTDALMGFVQVVRQKIGAGGV